ncbi:MAG: CAAX prenyl protease-related protein [Verrucomicrobiota bacterium]
MSKWTQHPAFPYIIPLAAFFIVHLAISGLHEDAQYISYPIATMVCIFLVFYNLAKYPPLFQFKKLVPTVLVGMVAACLWIVPYTYITSVDPDPTAGFNPEIFESKDIQICLIIIRMIGFCIMIPLVEEIFWRGFLQRYLIEEDFETVKLGSYTHLSFFATSLMIVLAHSDQWGVAIIWALLSSSWFIYTRSLGSMILLHAVTNFTLGVYIIVTKSWYFW